ncbi:hypothetical protein MAR_016130, partial [Mya arenaria]
MKAIKEETSSCTWIKWWTFVFALSMGTAGADLTPSGISGLACTAAGTVGTKKTLDASSYPSGPDDNTVGFNKCLITKYDRILVRKGDFIGWHNLGIETLAYDSEHFNGTALHNMFKRVDIGDKFPAVPPSISLNDMSVPDYLVRGRTVGRITYQDTDYMDNSSLVVVAKSSSPFYTTDLPSGSLKMTCFLYSAYGFYVTEYPNFTETTYNLEITCKANTLDTTPDEQTGTIVVTITDNLPPSITNLDDGNIQLNKFLTLTPDYQFDCKIEATDEHSNTDGPYNLHISISNINHQVTIQNMPASGLQLLENMPIGTLLWTFMYHDVDSDMKSWSIQYSHDEASRYFNLDPNTGELTLAHSVMDFETISPTTRTTYTLNITVGDIKSIGQATLEVTPYNVNEAPWFMETYYTIEMDEEDDGYIVSDGSIFLNSFVDEDLNSNLNTYEAHEFYLDCDNTTNTQRFLINKDTAAITLQGDYDLDATGTPDEVSCTVTVQDKYGLSDTTKLYIHTGQDDPLAKLHGNKELPRKKAVHEMFRIHNQPGYLNPHSNTRSTGSTWKKDSKPLNVIRYTSKTDCCVLFCDLFYLSELQGM